MKVIDALNETYDRAYADPDRFENSRDSTAPRSLSTSSYRRRSALYLVRGKRCPRRSGITQIICI